jgi:streptogramin lyase
VSRADAAVAALAGLLLFAAPATASDVVRVKLGSSLEHLIVGADGGAWVEIHRPAGQAIGRALPAGGFRTGGTEFAAAGSALGPDGQAWFRLGSRDYVRSDAAGNVTRVQLPEGPRLGRPMVTGRDGTLWNLTATGGRFAHVTPEGAVTYSGTRVPKCPGAAASNFSGMEGATDGAIWIIDQGCERLLRVTAAGTSVLARGHELEAIAPDAGGGMWFASADPWPPAGHVDAAGRLKPVELEDGAASDVAVAPDGSAWFSFDTCTLTRVTPAGEVATARAPIPAHELGFDAAGGLWLASHTRLVHVAPGEPAGPCDDRAPSLRITPGHDGGTISLKALRRGLRLALREPAVVEARGFASGDVSEDGLVGAPVVKRVMARAGSFRYRLPARLMRRIARRLAAGGRPGIGMYVAVTDAEGVQNVVQSTLRVRR